jgi:hypothetical protein
MDEHFRPIHGFPGYRVDCKGKVQSCWSRSVHKTLTGNWVSLKPVRRGRYQTVNLSNGVKKVACYVHRLVLEAFVGPCPEGYVCCHNDGNPDNNHLENLRWDSYRANEADKLCHGTRPLGSTARSKLHEEEVLEIRRAKAEGISIHHLATTYGVCRQNIEAIIYRKTWRHIP